MKIALGEIAHAHDKQGHCGKLCPRVPEQPGKNGNNINENDGDNEDGNGNYNSGIGHRAFYFFLQLRDFFYVRGKPVQNNVENTADLSGCYQVMKEVVEDFGMFFYGIGEGGAFLDVFFDLFNNPFEIGVGLLFLENVQALDQGQAGVDHRGKLADENHDVLVLDLCPRLPENNPPNPWVWDECW